MAALGSERPMFTPPWFRQDFVAHGVVHVPGADAILDNPHFADAARKIYGDGCVVRPTTVYVNVMAPTPFAFPPHLDVPAFRGFTRADQPIWLLKVMNTSGLFESWRTRIATAVSWFYEGPGGDFHYWPDGPDRDGATVSPPFDNDAVVADNEATFHGVAPLGGPGARMPEGLTRESSLVRSDHGWDVIDDGAVTTHFDDSQVRYTVSWKADVFRDEAEAASVDGGAVRLDLDTVVDMFLADLRGRGLAPEHPRDPLYDRDWVSLLGSTYRDRAPRIS
jgi:hypothetical protein